MFIKDWLVRNKMTARAMCEDIGLCPQALSRHLKGRIKLNAKWAVAIESYTLGEVSRQEALWPEDYIHEFEGKSVLRNYPRIHSREEIKYLKKVVEEEQTEETQE